MKPTFLNVVVILLAAVSTVIAQKLPAVQKNSLRSPGVIKIDGKATEWKNSFAADNRATDLHYTLSNDDDNLYLVVQTAFPDVIKRILNGGITFAVVTSGNKKDQDLKSVTFPVYTNETRFAVNFKQQPQIEKNDPKSVMAADSFMMMNNKKLLVNSKLIKTAGIKDVDTVISVYNEDHIKAVAQFNNKMVYTTELFVALKHFGLSTSQKTKFLYHIIINEVAEHGIDIKKDRNGQILSINVTKGAQQAQAATDFWGEYVLAEK